MKDGCAPSMPAATLSSMAFTLFSTRATPSSTWATLSSTRVTPSSTWATLLSMRTTLSLTICVASRTSAVTIRTSSFVSLSNLLSASSISVFPVSFFMYFSNKFLNQQQVVVQESHTYMALFHLLRANPKNRKHLHHYLHNDVHHFRWW